MCLLVRCAHSNFQSVLKTASQLHICSAINGNSNFCYNSIVLPMNQWTWVEIAQQANNAHYIYSIKIDDKLVYSVKNKGVKIFENVSVYAANPWGTPALAYIRGLEVEVTGFQIIYYLSSVFFRLIELLYILAGRV